MFFGWIIQVHLLDTYCMPGIRRIKRKVKVLTAGKARVSDFLRCMTFIN